MSLQNVRHWQAGLNEPNGDAIKTKNIAITVDLTLHLHYHISNTTLILIFSVSFVKCSKFHVNILTKKTLACKTKTYILLHGIKWKRKFSLFVCFFLIRKHYNNRFSKLAFQNPMAFLKTNSITIYNLLYSSLFSQFPKH